MIASSSMFSHTFGVIQSFSSKKKKKKKYHADQIIHRCVLEGQVESILMFCHTLACEGHFIAKKTIAKVLQSGFFLVRFHLIGLNKKMTASSSMFSHTLGDPELFTYHADQIIHRYVLEGQVQSILTFFHTLACEGHFSAKKTIAKVLQSGFF
jgi:hypothetical protein